MLLWTKDGRILEKHPPKEDPKELLLLLIITLFTPEPPRFTAHHHFIFLFVFSGFLGGTTKNSEKEVGRELQCVAASASQKLLLFSSFFFFWNVFCLLASFSGCSLFYDLFLCRILLDYCVSLWLLLDDLSTNQQSLYYLGINYICCN